MHAKTESALQSYIKRECQKASVLCYKFASPSRRGVPDLILVYMGRVVFVELKSPAKTGLLSPLQRYELELLTKQEAEVYVIDQYHEADDLINCIRSEYTPEQCDNPLVRVRPYTIDS